MHKTFPYRAVALVWSSTAVLAWFVGVPEWISLANFSWLNVLALAGCGTMLAIQRAGRPARSTAGILYDAEHSRLDR